MNSPEELSSHCKRVSEMAYEFGVYLGLSTEELNNLKLGAFLHDIGKIEISQDILFKKEITNEEFEMIKEHSTKGYNLLTISNCNLPKDSLDIVLQHHERIDGNGYPFKLKGNEINDLAKITSLCDVYDAITNTRSYKQAFDDSYALQQIQNGLNSQFDKLYGEKFIEYIQMTKLNNFNLAESIG